MDSPLQVILAGMNVDLEAMAQGDEELTPETICAAYARISRNPRPVNELRHLAREEIQKARATNQDIIFGMGHNSIAEHGVFNLDIIGVSRRIVEEVEKKRLASYTEKSQRYITLHDDFVVPPEIQATPIESEFLQLIKEQNKFYNENLDKLVAWHIKQNPELASNPDNKRLIEGWGKEDTRYALAMATQAQLGETISARNLERLIRELKGSEAQEARNLGEKIREAIHGVAPSVIKYKDPTDYNLKTRKELREYVSNLIIKNLGITRLKLSTEKRILLPEKVILFNNLIRDNSIPAGLIFSSSCLPFQQCLTLVENMPDEEKMELLDVADAYQEKHDPKLREYELGDRIAELNLSSSAFAQTKRHRMNTLIPQDYNISLPITIPASILATGLADSLTEIANTSSRFYEKMLQEGLPTIVAEYALTNAHKRRALLDANNRQMHAICAERENAAAQWDIRHLINELHWLVQQESPITTRYLCGKDTFDQVKAKRYSQD